MHVCALSKSPFFSTSKTNFCFGGMVDHEHCHSIVVYMLVCYSYCKSCRVLGPMCEFV